MFAMMFCPDCGADLCEIPRWKPCPGCGGGRRSANASAQSATARAEAHDPGVVTESSGSDEDCETVVRSHGRIARSEIQGGAPTQSYKWHSEGGENELDALHRFNDTLNAHDKNTPWRGECARELPKRRVVDGWLIPASTATGYVCEDGPPDGALLCQVTRVERETRARRPKGEVIAHAQRNDLIDAVISAVRAKDHLSVGDVVLLLDANDAPVFTDEVDLCSALHAALVERKLGTGWKDVWLIGPTTQRTWRIVGGSL